MGVPLVTIGIPTYNRPQSLERAVRSALSQTQSDLEVVVSNDASTDPEVAALLDRLSAEDARLRVSTQPQNLGHAANYQWVLEQSAGEYFMWLADDDWIDPGYVSQCLAVLQAEAGTVLVCGLARYYRGDAYVLQERPIELGSARAAVRIIQYFARVSLNGPLFGLVHRDRLMPVGFPQIAGGDWLLVAALAAQGRVRTLGDVHIHRSLTGLGADAQQLAASFGMRGWTQTQHHAVVAHRIAREIALGGSGFGALSPPARLGSAAAVLVLILARFTIAGLVRGLLGGKARWLERLASAWLRARDARRFSADRHH